MVQPSTPDVDLGHVLGAVNDVVPMGGGFLTKLLESTPGN